MMKSIDPLMECLAGREPVPSREVQRLLGVSQATVSRLVSRASHRVVRIGSGRVTRYAATELVFGTTASVPLYCVDTVGVISQVGCLRSLSSGQYLVQTGSSAPFWLLGEAGTGLFDSLPYFIYDLCPSGFLGRQVARTLASQWGFPHDPRSWQDEQIGQFLLRRGQDLPGNLLVGEAAADLAQRARPDLVRTEQYPTLAQRSLGDEQVGSSAAGEQPKFAVHHKDRGPVIVKFSPAAESSEAQRWRDLLHAEYHALVLMAQHGIPAAELTMHLGERRLFLESRRFDRHGVRGRSPSLSLTMVDAEYGGLGHGWTRVANALQQHKLLDSEALEQITKAETFGHWIGNTDMHLGNISLSPGEQGFDLLPLYDMLPMALAPRRGEMPEIELHPPLNTDHNRHVWAAAGEAAVTYWGRLAADGDLSRGFRELARGYGERCEEVLGT